MGRIWKAAQQLMSRLVLIVLAATAIATFASWRLAKLNEREHIQKMTRLAASAVEAGLRSDMEAWMLGQIRLAKMWEFEEPTYSQWSAFAGLYLEHHPGCVAIVWLDPKYQERWVSRAPGGKVPLAGDAAKSAAALSGFASSHFVKLAHLASRQETVAHGRAYLSERPVPRLRSGLL